VGTSTKSFGAAGMFFSIDFRGISIAATKSIINHLRVSCRMNVHAEQMTLTHTPTSFIVTHTNGTTHNNPVLKKITQLYENSQFFANGLRDLGFIVYGNDSPVIPLLLFHPTKMAAFSRMMLRRGNWLLLLVPSDPIISGRARFVLRCTYVRI
jgi:serine palmitoyltransferase